MQNDENIRSFTFVIMRDAKVNYSCCRFNGQQFIQKLVTISKSGHLVFNTISTQNTFNRVLNSISENLIPNARDFFIVQSTSWGVRVKVAITALIQPATTDLFPISFLVEITLGIPQRLKKSELKSHLNLTAQEIELAVALHQGITIADYSFQKDVSKETVRTQLKNLFSKTGTRRQIDLVSELSYFSD